MELGRGDEVVVRASQYPFPTVMGQPLEWFDSISRTLRWNTRAAEQKGWAGGEQDEPPFGAVERVASQAPEFDIDFDEDTGEEEEGARGRDSGYGGTSTHSEAGGVEMAARKGWR